MTAEVYLKMNLKSLTRPSEFDVKSHAVSVAVLFVRLTLPETLSLFFTIMS